MQICILGVRISSGIVNSNKQARLPMLLYKSVIPLHLSLSFFRTPDVMFVHEISEFSFSSLFRLPDLLFDLVRVGLGVRWSRGLVFILFRISGGYSN